MAEMEAEMALLQSMQEMNEAAGNYEANGVAGADQTISLSTEDNHQSQHVEEYSPTAHAEDPRNALPLPSSATSSETLIPDSTAHHPSVTLAGGKSPVALTASNAPVQVPLRPSSIEPPSNPQESVQPRTIAGFIINDDDDENDDNGDGNSINPSELAVSSGLVNATHSSGQSGISDVSLRPIPEFSDPRDPSQDVSPSNVASRSVSEAHQNGPADDSINLIPPYATTAAVDNGTQSQGAERPAQASDTDPAMNPEAPSAAIAKARLPHDRVGILEDRIKEDPRGDLDAWLSLITEHRKRNKIQDARNVYERYFKVFPMAAEQWVTYANMELANNDFYRVEQIFNKALRSIPNIQLWSLYLDYVRRRNNLTTDTAGTARTIISQAYDFVLQNVGIDKDAGRIWQEYVQFIRSGPGAIGGSNWQDQQKMDQLRKAYQRAICIPTSAVNGLWKEYDSFEMSLNKMTGRKFLQEKSPAYMTARSSYIELDNITHGLHRTTTPRLPPALGFDGDEEYLRQVALWKKWIQWEKDDPLVLTDEDVLAYRARVIYVFKQAVMALRFWPDIWSEASEFCFQNELEKEGNEFLSQGIDANPESCLLAFKRGDRLESILSVDEGEEGLKRRGAAVREPYNKLLDALYELTHQTKARETQEITRIEESFAKAQLPDRTRKNMDEEDDNEDGSDTTEAAKNAQIKFVHEGTATQIRDLSRTISFAWIALMRAMRRIQGKGKVGDTVGDTVGGSRQVFTDARKRGRLTSDVYVASALIEYHCYKDPAATKIFERGMKLFPEDEEFALEYLKHLIAINDITNARAVFETTVSRLGQKPETLQKAKPIYAFFHEYEAHYGELSQINKLEKRMAELFPDDPKLSQFGHRFTSNGFNPTAVRPIISPATQTRPKALPSIEQPPVPQNSPPRRLLDLPNSHSPKRQLHPDESDHDANRPRKFARGDSPLKGAAGRRLDQQKRTHQHQQHHHHNHHHQNQGPQFQGSAYHPPPPQPLPRDVLFLLSIIPRAETYPSFPQFKPQEVVRLLRNTELSKAQPRQAPAAAQQGHPQGPYPYPR
ncbi:MAG: mRNA 3'-end-processing protein rna14 [Peltula sp. TS41687]|nr:MAG: mRNA 3'-end-processing protein rna14 [Peltula sp. TS41687]